MKNTIKVGIMIAGLIILSLSLSYFSATSFISLVAFFAGAALVFILLLYMVVNEFLYTEERWKKVTIYPWLRWATNSRLRFFRKSFTREFKFTDDSKYNAIHSPGIQKLIGISLFHPHFWSYRIGWRYSRLSDEFHLFQYDYKAGKRKGSRYLATVNRDEPFKISIIDDKYITYMLIETKKNTYDFRCHFPKYRFPIYLINNIYAEVHKKISLMVR